MTETLERGAADAATTAFRVVNSPVKRADAREKIVGSTRYASDYELAGMLHARLLRSPVPSARIVEREIAQALLVPGVVAVYLGEDVPVNQTFVNVPGQQVEVKALEARAVVLATDRVRYHGEPVALIVAETAEALDEAEAAIEIGYEELPCVSDPAAALEPGSPSVHDGGNLLAEWRVDAGDVDAAFAAADVIVAGEYQAQIVDHAYLEPEAGVGWLDDEGVINIRASTQVVEHFRDVANILGLPHSKVRIIAPYIGGGFGGKEDMTIEPYIALAVHLTGRPVKMVWSRRESLTARPKRHPVRMQYRTAARDDGTLLAQDVKILADGGAYPLLSAYVLLYLTINATGPYRVPSVRVESRAAYTNNTPCSAFRGFGGMQPVFGYEGQIDAVARRVGLDGAEIRKRNAMRKGDAIPAGQRIETAVWLPECIDRAVAALGERPRPSGPRHAVGRGLGCNMQSYGRLVWLNDSSSAWVGYELDGSVTVRCGVPDIGAGQVSALAQIAAEILCVEMDVVSVHFGDSARTPLAGTTTATRQLYMSGNATLQAAEMLRDQVLKAVADDAGWDVAELTLSPAGITTPDGMVGIRAALGTCVRTGVPINAMATFYGPRGQEVDKTLRSDRLFPDVTFGAHAADVEVDLDTGAVRVLRYAACHDVGRAINPVSVRGQITGAVAQGIGYALYERIVLQESVNMTGGFFQYCLPTAADVPDIEAIFLESGEGLGPFGARGIGEPPIGPCAATIASAIEDAIGARPVRLPMLGEVVLDCMSAETEGK